MDKPFISFKILSEMYTQALGKIKVTLVSDFFELYSFYNSIIKDMNGQSIFTLFKILPEDVCHMGRFKATLASG